MESKKTIFNYISDVFTMYGVIVSVYILLSLIVGDYVGELSSLFRLGSAGLSTATLLQLLLLASIIVIAQNIFLADRWIKNMTVVLRNVLFFLTIMVATAVLIVLFDWFPVNDLKAWGGFFLSFTVSTLISGLISRLKERAENDSLQAALEKYNKKKDISQ
ncbi:MAG: hypothetical protein GX884_03545 [Chloroflexi bacterium]|jgi:hypothetical protein|nr:hypothetical protein [Chloroflexota bacterium]